MTVVHMLPGYNVSENFTKDYVDKVKEIANSKSVSDLFDHIFRWSELLDVHWDKEYDLNKVLEKLVELVDPPPHKEDSTEEPSEEESLAAEILLPVKVIIVWRFSKQFGAPDFTCLHQAFCESTDHNKCFSNNNEVSTPDRAIVWSVKISEQTGRSIFHGLSYILNMASKAKSKPNIEVRVLGESIKNAIKSGLLPAD